MANSTQSSGDQVLVSTQERVQESDRKYRGFIQVEVHTWEGSAGELKDWVALRKSLSFFFFFHPSLWQYLGILHWVCLLPVGGPSVFCSFVLVLFLWNCHGVRWESQWPWCKWHYNELKVRPQSGSGLLTLLDKTSSCFPLATGYSFLWNWK